MDTELFVKKLWSAPELEDDGGAEKSCVAHNNQRTVSERFYRDHGDSASKYPSKYPRFVSEDGGIEPRTVATLAFAVRDSNHSARSHPLHGVH
jgi:hypothetical protein